MQASDLPGGVVKQNRPQDGVKGDCFSACLSMLTGVPLNSIPVLPPTVNYALIEEYGAWYLHVHRDVWTEQNLAWKKMLADSGLKFDITPDRPTTYPYIAAMIQIDERIQTYGHVILVLNESEVVDPAVGEVVAYNHDYPEVWYATVTPM